MVPKNASLLDADDVDEYDKSEIIIEDEYHYYKLN